MKIVPVPVYYFDTQVSHLHCAASSMAWHGMLISHWPSEAPGNLQSGRLMHMRSGSSTQEHCKPAQEQLQKSEIQTAFLSVWPGERKSTGNCRKLQTLIVLSFWVHLSKRCRPYPARQYSKTSSPAWLQPVDLYKPCRRYWGRRCTGACRTFQILTASTSWMCSGAQRTWIPTCQTSWSSNPRCSAPFGILHANVNSNKRS